MNKLGCWFLGILVAQRLPFAEFGDLWINISQADPYICFDKGAAVCSARSRSEHYAEMVWCRENIERKTKKRKDLRTCSPRSIALQNAPYTSESGCNPTCLMSGASKSGKSAMKQHGNKMLRSKQTHHGVALV